MVAVLKLVMRTFFFISCVFVLPMGFLAAAAVFGIGWAIGAGNCLEDFGIAMVVGLYVAIYLAAPFALIMTVGLCGWHVWAVWRLGYRLTDETLSVRQRRLLTIERPFAEAFTLCLDSVRYLGGAHVEEETDFGTGVILASKRMSWLGGMGEQIRFDLRGGGGRTEVEVTCRPRVRTVFMDGGVSLRNMDAIVGFLLAHGASSEGASGLKRSEHVRASSDRVEQSPARVRPDDGPSPPSEDESAAFRLIQAR